MELELYLKELGKRIEKLRKEKGMSQNELARRLGTKNNQIRRIEKGLANCTVATLWKVAEALEVEFGELLG